MQPPERLRKSYRMDVMTRTSFAFLFLASLFGSAAMAATAAELQDAAPPGGEICRFRALDAENPFRRWLASQEVTCVAAGTSLAFPPGQWNVFARAGGLISSAPLLIDGNAAPAELSPALAPAATVAPLLSEGRSGVLYAPRRGSAFPVAGARTLVPADEPLWLFVLDQSVPVGVIPIAPLPAGTTREVDARKDPRPVVIGWLRAPERDRAVLPKATGLSSPGITAGGRQADPLPPVSLLDGAFFRVSEVAAGNAELRLAGRGWVPDRRVVNVQPGVTIFEAPLLVRAAGTLVVHWNAESDLAVLDREIGACAAGDPPQLAIAIARCQALRPGERLESVDCATIREEKPASVFGSMTFDDAVPGAYRAELRYGKLPPISATANVGPARVADLRLLARYETAYGSVTRGGEPLGEDLSLQFAGGIGFAAADEEYRAVFRSPLDSDAQITIEACDGSPRAVVLTDRPLRPRARLDIDIPDNELVVQVNDTFTREPLPGAIVKMEAMAIRRLSRVALESKRSADREGKAIWNSVPVRELHFTVTHGGYEPRKVEPFTMVKSGTRTLDVQLVPLRGTRGKIVADRPFDSAVVVWFSAAGVETERADVAPEGTFTYVRRHTPDETLAVVSASHPLWVVRAPATDGRENLTLAFPAAQAASFDVWLAGASAAAGERYVGVSIGGVRVPQPLLAQHQTQRRQPPLIRGSGPYTLRDLLVTGPIEVLLGPASDDVTGRARNMDLFALPQYADVPRRRFEPGTTDVVFTLR